MEGKKFRCNLILLHLFILLVEEDPNLKSIEILYLLSMSFSWKQIASILDNNYTEEGKNMGYRVGVVGLLVIST